MKDGFVNELLWLYVGLDWPPLDRHCWLLPLDFAIAYPASAPATSPTPTATAFPSDWPLFRFFESVIIQLIKVILKSTSEVKTIWTLEERLSPCGRCFWVVKCGAIKIVSKHRLNVYGWFAWDSRDLSLYLLNEWSLYVLKSRDAWIFRHSLCP